MGAITWGTRHTHFFRQWGISHVSHILLFRFHNKLVSHQAVPPRFYNKIALMTLPNRRHATCGRNFGKTCFSANFTLQEMLYFTRYGLSPVHINTAHKRYHSRATNYRLVTAAHLRC